MRTSLLASIALVSMSCIANPTDYPFRPLSDATRADADTHDTDLVDADLADTKLADVGPVDASPDPADVGPADADFADVERHALLPDASLDVSHDADASAPTTPTRYDCSDPNTSCAPLVCEGACEVDCRIKDATCAVSCDTDARCRLDCKGNVESCTMEQCDDPIRCGKGWVCNGDC